MQATRIAIMGRNIYGDVYGVTFGRDAPNCLPEQSPCTKAACTSAHTSALVMVISRLSSSTESEQDNAKATHNVAGADAIRWSSPVLVLVELSVSVKLPSAEETAVQGRAKTFAPLPLVEFSTKLDG